MQDVIRLLPESLANQIAAGEVVQRPASVVKELLENSVDAGSANITLIVKDAGKTLIQVIDDGKGMSETDARMSFERHATSKITSTDDLFAIHTFGFRGEALASIAAVSQVEMKTRREDDEMGTLIEVEGGERKEQEPVSVPVGTSIAVKNLFFNIPARRKFLKSNPVEMKHIIDEFQRVALVNPEISMTLYQDDNEVYNLRAGKMAKRIISIFGRSHQEQLFPCQEDLEVMSVNGYIGKPESAKKTRGEQFFFVNGRFIKHSYLHHAVMTAYEGLLPDSTYPFYMLNIQVDPKDVDVNVHPTKTEVKFTDERTLYAIVSAAVKQALASYGVAPSIDFGVDVNFANENSSEEGSQENSMFASSGINVDFTEVPMTFPSKASGGDHSFSSDDMPFDNDDSSRFVTKVSSRINNWDDKTSLPQPAFKTAWQQYDPMEMESDNFPDGQQAIIPEEEQSSPAAITFSSRANELDEHKQDEEDTKLGDKIEPIQLRNRYILYQVKSGIMLLNQEAAHERILYERFLHEIENHSGVTQKLLFPNTLSLNPADFVLLSEFTNEIASLGFSIQIKSQNTVVVNGVPAIIKDANEQDILEGIIEQIKYNTSHLSISHAENIARSLAKRTCIKQGQVMETAEMRSIIEQLFACSNPNYSPDGRKTIVLLRMDEIEKLFQ
ncbi:DNA mismatch repair endonuclease MutL [Limibacter armeniacum]|uniref:DNA mismatch repair endonuclease MutL n=1 Tax=Limibacter armeniacum TaxID=466084 RepID=UPI002FE665ED